MNDLILLTLMTISYFILLLYDFNKYKTCINEHREKIISILIVHRALFIFLSVGWLSSNKTILTLYLLTLVGLFIHWQTNNCYCVLTQLHNKFCNLPDDKQYDFCFTMFNRETACKLSYTCLFVLAIIVIYKISK